jgi:chorismate-pyruvate lyase
MFFKDECSFVSLRDVERVLEVMTWFYRQTEEGLLSEENMDFDEDKKTKTLKFMHRRYKIRSTQEPALIT